MTDKPSVGRVVHYVSYGTPGGEYTRECRAAIVTEIDPPTPEDSLAYNQRVGLCVLNPTGQFFSQHVCHDYTSSRNGGTWHWPERV